MASMTNDGIDAMLTEAIACKRKQNENVTVLTMALDAIRRLTNENAELHKAAGKTRDGKVVRHGDAVYMIFPGDRGATTLTVMPAHARTQSYEHCPVYECFSTREAAEAARKEAKSE